MIGLAALGSHVRIKHTSGVIGSFFVLSYALEMFPRYFSEKTETQLAEDSPTKGVYLATSLKQLLIDYTK